VDLRASHDPLMPGIGGASHGHVGGRMQEHGDRSIDLPLKEHTTGGLLSPGGHQTIKDGSVGRRRLQNASRGIHGTHRGVTASASRSASESSGNRHRASITDHGRQVIKGSKYLTNASRKGYLRHMPPIDSEGTSSNDNDKQTDASASSVPPPPLGDIQGAIDETNDSESEWLEEYITDDDMEVSAAGGLMHSRHAS